MPGDPGSGPKIDFLVSVYTRLVRANHPYAEALAVAVSASGVWASHVSRLPEGRERDAWGALFLDLVVKHVHLGDEGHAIEARFAHNALDVLRPAIAVLDDPTGPR